MISDQSLTSCGHQVLIVDYELFPKFVLYLTTAEPSAPTKPDPSSAGSPPVHGYSAPSPETSSSPLPSSAQWWFPLSSHFPPGASRSPLPKSLKRIMMLIENGEGLTSTVLLLFLLPLFLAGPCSFTSSRESHALFLFFSSSSFLQEPVCWSSWFLASAKVLWKTQIWPSALLLW